MSVKNKVFVTGANGKIGIKLVKKLLKLNYQVTALVRRRESIDFKSKNLEVIVADLLDTNKYEKELKACDYIIHLAAYQNIFDKKIDEFRRVNVDGVKKLINLVNKSKVKKFFYVSTVMVLESKDNFYVKTKSEATRLVKKSKVPWIILYPRIVIDKEWKADNWLTSILTGNIQGGLNMRFGPKDRTIKFIWIDDLISKIVALISNGKVNDEYILESKEMRADNYLKMMYKLKNKIYIPWRIPFINTG